MNRTVILAFFGFGFCIAAAVKVLPSKEILAIINDENVFAFFKEFLIAFIKNPFSWVGITTLFIAFREPVISRNSTTNRRLRPSGTKPE